MNRLKVGIIGCGWAAQHFHIPNYQKHSKADIVALCDSDQQLLSQVSQAYRVPSTFTDYRELFETTPLDAVSVCTPTPTHATIVKTAADHGIHVLCEKPIASSLDDADAMLDAVARNTITFMVGFNFRFLPNHNKMKEYLAAGRVGKPIYMRGEGMIHGPYSEGVEHDTMLVETVKRRGVLFDFGAHLADLFIWMMGKPTEVTAFFSTYKDAVTVDDTASLLIRFASGVVGQMIVS